ncbi:MAG TPA: tRNA (adenosine(37)-N6)-threonylcarbamoyltransferase complex ATPase subunit type 1 TsaE [Haloplasmataceae bacterium]
MGKQYVYQFINEQETIAFGERIGRHLFSGAVITLEGPLGAGKTTLTKGIAKGLDIHQTVNSPTFTIVKEYNGRLPLYHIDAYRLEDAFEDLGLEDYFFGEGVTVVEWPDKISSQIPPAHLKVKIASIDENIRKIELIPQSSEYEWLCEVIDHA